ncbi:MAG: 6-carboxytetrahydropterin synthase QueD [Candidatus Omnitrophota bacterium]|nr:MAG: 6-carboxytetrahydropterin synthase QueD [Candidatus Omnitrophota bacterium]
MFKIKIISYFSGAHNLKNYKGKCESLHGHNWKVEVVVKSSKLDKAGMVMDFSNLKKITNDVLNDLDHHYLNEIEYFKSHNPSSEELARYIFEKLKEPLAQRSCVLEEVRVWETESSCATYRQD